MKQERGAVSIFIVIFTALLVTVVTTSFVQIMLQNQQQAGDNDLSQSAYDSAMAGVEDAKRALVRLKKCQKTTPMTPDCSRLESALTNIDAQTNCEILGHEDVNVAEFDEPGHEREVRVGTEDLNQAYTCVTVDVETPAYQGELYPNDQADVIPLLPAEPATTAEIQAVRISWYTNAVQDDGASSDLPANATLATMAPSSGTLPIPGNWPDAAPPLIRAQLIQFNKGSVDLSRLDGEGSRTRLLYPSVNPHGTIAIDNFANDVRGVGPKNPTVGNCKPNFPYSGYACSVEVALPAMPAGETREAYLHIAGIYLKNRGTHYKVEMLSSLGVNGRLDFDNVQPVVDSTGRASDLFRRVKASVNVTEAGPEDKYPDAALSVGNICKEFFITNIRGDYNGRDNNGNTITCTP